MTPDGKMRILLCEDDENLGMLLANIFKQRAMTPCCAAMVKKAIANFCVANTISASST